MCYYIYRCRQCWFDGKFTPSCPECGGYPLQRPCVVCSGQCNQIWQRNVKKVNELFIPIQAEWRECSGSVVDCLTRDREAAGLSLTSFTGLCT